MPNTRIFEDRRDAGRALAAAAHRLLTAEPALRDPIVLALPRGGVPVAAEIAAAIEAPLDLVMVRKIGVPGHPEIAAGAVVDGLDPQLVVNEGVVAVEGVSREALEGAMARKLVEIERRRSLFLQGRSPLNVASRNVFVIDDGVATGATMHAALKALRLKAPRSVSVFTPVAPEDVARSLERLVDHFVCLSTPRPFDSVGAAYRDFHQLSDDEVVGILAAAQSDVARSDE